MKNNEYIEEIRFALHPDIIAVVMDEPVPYRGMAEIMKNTKLYNEIKEKGLDTPIIYYYKNRSGYIRGQVFMNYCIPQEMSLIQVGVKKSYIVHPDQAKTAVHIEQRILEERDDYNTPVSHETVRVSQLQIDLNVEEHFIW